ncbi:hypothetical protein R7127_08055 [Vibrio sp. 1159]|uniref:hypothetical protein n=1 Tax=Vibrio sp. 1159 TaxID=3074545 RepID=UPI0029651AEC|nr:hypothetical protein [Vibrio sp. 1159]MDW2320232.1 hypothetical protein [Vibrio sp. 1159]
MCSNLKNPMPEFDITDTTYLYNCAGDYVGEEEKAAYYDSDRAQHLCHIVSNWVGAEFAVVLRRGVLGVIAEQEFSDMSIRDKAITELLPVYSKFNGVRHIHVGLIDNDSIWPQMFLPASVVFDHVPLSTSAVEAFSKAIENL